MYSLVKKTWAISNHHCDIVIYCELLWYIDIYCDMITAQQTVVNDWEFRDVFRGQTREPSHVQHAARRASCWWLPGVSVAVEDSGCIGCLTGWSYGSYGMLWGCWPLMVVSAGVPTTHLGPNRLPRKYRHQWLQYDPGNCVTHNLLWHRNVLEFWGGAYLSPKASGLFQQTELCTVPTMNGDSYKVQADMWNHTKHIHLKCLGSVLATVEQRSLDFWYLFCVSESLEHFLFVPPDQRRYFTQPYQSPSWSSEALLLAEVFSEPARDDQQP